ncbi:MAG: adenylate/guanylate cyclase domain-containing protein [Candidatus Riflebacteria bacterium]|nr:adenylate/guanylate cyclase domain-containing protein [Candidatus Riflebacteria bacterium]
MKEKFTIQNLFVFAVIVILPVCVAYYSINNMIEEQYLAKRESVVHELRQQIARLEKTSKAEHQIQDFLSILVKNKKICRQKPEVLKDFIKKADEAYPGAFKWIFLDENYDVLHINSPFIVEGTRYWQKCLKGGIYVSSNVKDNHIYADYDKTIKEYLDTISPMQRYMGSGDKPEHIFEKNNNAIKTKWLKKDCYIVWDYDRLSSTLFGAPKTIAGICGVLIFTDTLPENFWYKRLIMRRQKSKDEYKFPIAAINISKNRSFLLDSALPQSGNFVKGLIDAYNSRTSELFEYGNFIIGSTVAPDESELRLLSFVDMSESLIDKGYMQMMLSITCIILVIICSILSFYIKRLKLGNISLRQRIAAVFLIAIILPLLSLISIGKTFISHEEGRLKESAYVRMRSGLEALSMRYKDTPRLIETGLYNQLKGMIGSEPYTLEQVASGMQKAVDEGMINQYILFKNEGGIATTSWIGLEKPLEKTLIFMSKQVLKKDENVLGYSRKNLAQEAIEEELEEIVKSVGEEQFDFSRPTHLRHFVYLDTHLYFMTIKVVINKKTHPLFVYVQDKLVEKNFAAREFASNYIAAQQLPGSVIIPELSFYYDKRTETEKTESEETNTKKSKSEITVYESYPPNSPVWKKLKNVLDSSNELKIEEIGNINIDGENFLYLIKPLSSMNSQSYLPCLLTSAKPIESRLRDVGILLFALSTFAVLGSISLSFILSSSLLEPIKKIDSAAQQIGKGNLKVFLPEEGKDELARLSMTFNAMVKGLRERAKMRAYVSDSVLEAVKDNSDQTVHEGKHIEATILFSDIRNFTGISEANTPDRIFEVLNEFLGGAEPIIRINHGRVDKFIGDAVMAIFHDTEQEHHALSAIKAAVGIKYFVSLMNKDRAERGLFPIEIGIGISTGHVLLGDVGSRHRKDLTVIGDEVNLASRLETASKQGHYSKIIFSGQTLKFIEDYVEAVKMPFEEIRGKKNAVQIYEFVKFKDNELGKQEYTWNTKI